jgi:hypothetical protein
MEVYKMSRITKKELTEKVEKIVKNLTDMEQKTIKHFALTEKRRGIYSNPAPLFRAPRPERGQ